MTKNLLNNGLGRCCGTHLSADIKKSTDTGRYCPAKSANRSFDNMATSSWTDMPVWVDDSRLSCEWLWSKLDCKHQQPQQQTCSVEDISNEGRLGTTCREGVTLLVTLMEQDNRLQIVMKQISLENNSVITISRQLGLAREALFYKLLAPHKIASESSSLPRIYYAHGDMKTGEKCILMEALLRDWLDSGILFGPGNPNNWKRNLPSMLAEAYGSDPIPSAAAVAKATFVAIAHTHAAFWKNKLLLEPSKHWLRGQEWLQGQGKESWDASQNLIKGIWKSFVLKESGIDNIAWNPIVRAAVEKAVAGISWQAHLDRLTADGRWTLVHGDFWPGNVMLHTRDGTVRMLDWEMVGLGSGPQDLGQYVISNMNPLERRGCEHDLVRGYYEELVQNGVENEDDLWNYCWKEYKVGGVERWLWYMVYFVGQPSLTDWAQFFHNQIASFMEDHKLTANDITQPRP